MIDFDAEGSGKQAQLVLTLSSLLKIQQRFVIHWHKHATCYNSRILYMYFFSLSPTLFSTELSHFALKSFFFPSDWHGFFFSVWHVRVNLLTNLPPPPHPPPPKKGSDWIVYQLCFLYTTVVSDKSTWYPSY